MKEKNVNVEKRTMRFPVGNSVYRNVSVVGDTYLDLSVVIKEAEKMGFLPTTISQVNSRGDNSALYLERQIFDEESTRNSKDKFGYRIISFLDDKRNQVEYAIEQYDLKK